MAEQTLYAIDKTIEDTKEHITEEEKTQLLALKDELSKLLEVEEKDIEAIKAKETEINETMQPIVMRMYEQAQQAAEATGEQPTSDANDDVIDAEFEEKK